MWLWDNIYAHDIDCFKLSIIPRRHELQDKKVK